MKKLGKRTKQVKESVQAYACSAKCYCACAPYNDMTTFYYILNNTASARLRKASSSIRVCR